MTSEARKRLFDKLYSDYSESDTFTITRINEILDMLDQRDRTIELYGEMINNLSAEAKKFVADNDRRFQNISDMVAVITKNVQELTVNIINSSRETQSLREIIKHIWYHSDDWETGYRMTIEQKQLFDSIIQSTAADADASSEPPRLA